MSTRGIAGIFGAPRRRRRLGSKLQLLQQLGVLHEYRRWCQFAATCGLQLQMPNSAMVHLSLHTHSGKRVSMQATAE